jgi:dephospho-CoA kinase
VPGVLVFIGDEKMFVALTGGIGSGKSTVLEMFRKKGASTLDCDQSVKQLWRPGSPVYSRLEALVKAAGLLKSGQKIPVKAVAREVFRSRPFRRRLENIIHPEIFKKISLARKQEKGILIIEIPLLFETGFNRKADFVVTVEASPRNSMARLRKKGGLSSVEWKKRAKSQWPLKKKTGKSDFVIKNDGTKAETKRQVEVIWQILNLMNRKRS